METLLTLALFAVVASIGLLLADKRRQQRLHAWRLAARRVGLTDVQADDVRRVLSGRSGDLHVSLESYSAGDSERGTRIVVTGLAEGLSLRREGLSTALERRVVGDSDIRIGDPSFDREYYVQGSAPLALALLDAEAREPVAALMRNRVATAGGGSVKARVSLLDGVLEARVEDGRFRVNLQRTPDVLAHVLQVARRLVAPRDLAARIAENLRAEPEAGVRFQCLRTLAREFRGHLATREALLRAREDPDPEIRLEAGIALDREGRDVVLAIARGEGAPDETGARAVAVLAGDLSDEEAADLLRNALRARRLASARECLRVLGQRRGALVVTTLAKVLAVEKGELAAGAAEALGATDQASAESALVSALDHPVSEARVAAARALGRVGTAAAVQPLKDLEGRDGSCRAAARQAVAEIQARLTGAEPGQLSLAAGEAGQLSIADGEEGRLSLATSPREASSESGDERCAGGADPLRPRGKRQTDG